MISAGGCRRLLATVHLTPSIDWLFACDSPLMPSIYTNATLDLATKRVQRTTAWTADHLLAIDRCNSQPSKREPRCVLARRRGCAGSGSPYASDAACELVAACRPRHGSPARSDVPAPPVMTGMWLSRPTIAEHIVAEDFTLAIERACWRCGSAWRVRGCPCRLPNTPDVSAWR